MNGVGQLAICFKSNGMTCTSYHSEINSRWRKHINIKITTQGVLKETVGNGLLLCNKDILRQDTKPKSFKDYSITRQSW